DEDGVHLVYDGEVVPPLGVVPQVELHVVPQVVEAQLGVGAIGDGGGVGALSLLIGEPVDDDAHVHAQEAVHLPHPLGVAGGQVLVHRDHVHAAIGDGVEVHRQGG